MKLVNMLLRLQELENKKLERENKGQKTDAEQILGEITLLKAQIPGETITRFYKLYNRFGEALVSANGGVCHGCFINLPSSQAVEINHSENLHVCQNCGRFIYSDSKEAITIF